MATPTRFPDIPTLLAALGQLPPERPALTFYQGRTRAGGQSYGELLAAVERVTLRLRDQLGLVAGDRIAILSPNRLEVPALLLGAMTLGVVVVPLNPTTSPADWDYILGHSEARAIFGTRELLERITRKPELVCPFEDPPAPEPIRPPAAAPLPQKLDRTLAVVLYTSGTTGNPKGVALPQASLLANAWSLAVNFGLDAETQLAVLPLYHAHAFGFGLMTALTTGGHLVFTERFDPFSWAEVIRAEAVTLTSVVPTLLVPLQQLVRRDKVPGLRAILVSSAPLTVASARAFEAKVGVPLLQGWGLSEYTNFACCLSPSVPDAERKRLLLGDQTAGEESGALTSIGSPLSGTEVKVIGLDGTALGAGARGELCVRGHSTMLGYYRDPAATAAALDSEGWLRTGDEGFFEVVGGKPNFFITGRIKEIIIRDGDKYSPLAIERQLCAALPGWEGRMVILGFPHELHGEEIGAYVETDAVDDDLRARLTAAVAALPLELRPKVVLHGAAPIPRTHTGKVQRRKLHAAFAPYRTCKGALQIAPVESGPSSDFDGIRVGG
jgi:long-chain acyl-CoA synthetase